MHGADKFAFSDDDVNAPDRFFFRRALAAMGQDRVLARDEFRLDKKIAERLVCSVRILRREDDFRVAG